MSRPGREIAELFPEELDGVPGLHGTHVVDLPWLRARGHRVWSSHDDREETAGAARLDCRIELCCLAAFFNRDGREIRAHGIEAGLEVDVAGSDGGAPCANRLSGFDGLRRIERADVAHVALI